jgi:TolB protein
MFSKDRLAVALAAAAVVSAGLPAAASAAWPGLDGRIATAFEEPREQPRGGDLEIVTWSQDGVRKTLTDTTTDDTQPSVSPDGTMIAFRTDRLSTRTDPREQIYVVPLEGGDDRRVSQDAPRTGRYSSQPAWTPDGRRLVFRSNRDNASTRKGDVYTMDLDGRNIVRLIASPDTDERYPTLSPDGTRLLFTSDRGGTFGVYVANADGSDVRLLYDGPAQDSAPAWSPDGTKVAFETFTIPDVDGDVFVMDADPETADTPVAIAADPMHDEGPAWSPDGSSIAFTSDRGGNSDTYVAAADGSDPYRLTDPAAYEESPDWQAIPFDTTGFAGCNDTVAAPGEAFGVVANDGKCETATRVAGRWAADGGEDAKVQGFECDRAKAIHSEDQRVVTCEHRGDKKAVAFVSREVR